MRPRALVTGAAARVGRAIALELARSGFDVAVHHRSGDPTPVVEACGEGSFAVAADLEDPLGCATVVQAVRARWDGLDLLVNNASRFSPVPFEQLDVETWDRMQAINVRAPFLLSAGLLPLLRARKGCVVHLCDIGAERPVSGYAHYSVSKAALVMLVRAMAVELAPDVRTVGISPGQVAWPEDYDEAMRAKLARRIPLGRVGTPEEVARLVRFVATEGTYLNGAVIPVDGGLGARY